MNSFRNALALLLVSSLIIVSCSENPVTNDVAESTEALAAEEGQERVRLNTNTYTKSPNTETIQGSKLRVVGVGANFGQAAAAEVCGTGDLPCDYSEISEAAFNSLSVYQLRERYDVLIFTWISSSSLNADWNSRLVPFMHRGGNIIFEDPGNTSDLSPGVGAQQYNTGGDGIFFTNQVPVLTQGINTNFHNNHMRFTYWTPQLKPFMKRGNDTIGLWGKFGNGCIVLTGTDQHFHAEKFGDSDDTNQYKFLKNEIEFVKRCSGRYRVH